MWGSLGRSPGRSRRSDWGQIIINGGWDDGKRDIDKRDIDKRDIFLWKARKRDNLLRLIRNPSDWASLSVTCINNAGVIPGSGSYRGRPHAFLLTPQ